MERTDTPHLRVQASSDRALLADPKLLITVGLGLLTIIAIAFVIGFNLWYGSRVYPGVKVLGIDLGGKSVNQATVLIRDRMARNLAEPIVLRYGKATYNVPAPKLGLNVNARATARRAYEYGRSGGLLHSIGARLQAWRGGYQIPIVLSLDNSKATGVVSRFATMVNRPVRDASIRLTGSGPVLVHAQTGVSLNVTTTTRNLRASLNALYQNGKPVSLIITEHKPQVTDAQLSDDLKRISSAWNSPVTVTSGGRSWSLSLDQVHDMLGVRSTGSGYFAYLDSRKLRDWVQQIAVEIVTEPRNASVDTSVPMGKVIPDVSGVTLLVDESLSAVANSVQAPGKPVALKTSTIPAEIRAQDLQPAVEKAHTLAGQPVMLTLEDKSWAISSSTLTDWLRWEGTGKSINPYLDPNSIRAWVQQLATEANQKARDAYLTAWNGDTYLGEISLVPSRQEIVVDTNATSDELSKLTSSVDQHTGNVVARITDPAVTTNDLEGPLAEARKLTGSRLYLNIAGARWWLDPANLVKASHWTDNQGARTRVWLDEGELVSQIEQFLPSTYDGWQVDYQATAANALTALDKGDHSVDVMVVANGSQPAPAATHKADLYMWNGQYPDKWIDINLSQESMTAYAGDKPVRTSLVTTGNYVYPDRRTPTGLYHIMTKLSPYEFVSPWPKSSPYYYPPSKSTYAMRFRDGGYYIHDAPWRSQFGPGTNMDYGTPGSDRTGSHGCVNTPPDMMKWLWSWAPDGTPVVIHY